jgi:hypothetical protein
MPDPRARGAIGLELSEWDSGNSPLRPDPLIFYILRKKLTGKGCLPCTIRTRDDVEAWSSVFILQMIPSFNALSFFEHSALS